MADVTDSLLGEGSLSMTIQRRLDISWKGRGPPELTFWKNGHSVNWYEIYSPMSDFLVNNPDFMEYAFPERPKCGFQLNKLP